jgi:hypothetical protein
MPTRKELVAIPADLASHDRVLMLARDGGLTREHAVAIVVYVLAALAKTGGDLSGLHLADLIGPHLVDLFTRLFIDKGRCPLYDEYNGARDRHREANRRWRGKAPKKARVALFPEAWKAYPKRSGGNPRALAQKAWDARVKEGVREEALLSATKHYAAHCQQEGKAGTAFVLQGGTFYGPARRWEDFLTAPADPEMDEIMDEIRRSFEEA